MDLCGRKPCTLLAALFAIPFLILAFTTKHNACYEQVDGLSYAKIDDTISPWCQDQCSDDIATSKIAHVTGAGTTDPIPGASYDPETPGLKIVVRCAWSGKTGRLFLACTLMIVVWVALELLLAAKRKYPFLLNIVLILVIGLIIPNAIYQLDDINERTCNDITTPSGIYQGTRCYPFWYNLSFILNFVMMVLLLAQLFFNIIRRKVLNEEDPKYADIPQRTRGTHSGIPQETKFTRSEIPRRTNLAHDNVPLVINSDANRLQ